MDIEANPEIHKTENRLTNEEVWKGEHRKRDYVGSTTGPRMGQLTKTVRAE